MTTEAGAGKVLTTDASGVASWQTAAAGATPAGSTGYIQFNNASALGADSNLFWDNTNKRLGIGTTTPAYALDVNGALRLQPSGVPSASKGVIYYDQSTDTFKGYLGDSWVNLYQGSQTGYMISTVSGTTSVTLKKNAAADIFISPIFIPFTINVNSFLLQVTTALGSTGDVGFYNSNGQLLLNGGSGTLTTATGLKSVAPVQTGSARLIPPGQYYVAITWNSTTGVIAGVNVSGLIPRSGTITGGGLVLPSSITLSNITETNYIYAVTFSGSDQKENGVICSVNGDCLSNFCYIDNDGDKAYGTSGTALCRAFAAIGLDCNDACATCYTGSTAYTTTPDGKDQNCNGTIDEFTGSDYCIEPSGSWLNCCYFCDTLGYYWRDGCNYSDCNTIWENCTQCAGGIYGKKCLCSNKRYY